MAYQLTDTPYALASNPTWLSAGGFLLLTLIGFLALGVRLDARRCRPKRQRSTIACGSAQPIRHRAAPTRHRGRPVPVRRTTFIDFEPSKAILKGGI